MGHELVSDKFQEVAAATARKDWRTAISILQVLAQTSEIPAEKRRASRRLAETARLSGDLDLAARTLRVHLANHPNDSRARGELARYLAAREASADDSKARYWRLRSNYIYLHAVRVIAAKIAGNANVVADIGSNGTPILEWFPNVPVRYSVDPSIPYRGKNIRSVKADFLAWEPERKINVLTCFQVMEHVPDAASFAQKILALADVSIVSVPYKWRADKTSQHVHDPVDELKMHSWFGREPNYAYYAKETNGEERFIHVYDRKDASKWPEVFEYKFRFRWSLRGAESVLA